MRRWLALVAIMLSGIALLFQQGYLVGMRASHHAMPVTSATALVWWMSESESKTSWMVIDSLINIWSYLPSDRYQLVRPVNSSESFFMQET